MFFMYFFHITNHIHIFNVQMQILMEIIVATFSFQFFPHFHLSIFFQYPFNINSYFHFLLLFRLNAYDERWILKQIQILMRPLNIDKLIQLGDNVSGRKCRRVITMAVVVTIIIVIIIKIIAVVIIICSKFNIQLAVKWKPLKRHFFDKLIYHSRTNRERKNRCSVTNTVEWHETKLGK